MYSSKYFEEPDMDTPNTYIGCALTFWILSAIIIFLIASIKILSHYFSPF